MCEVSYAIRFDLTGRAFKKDREWLKNQEFDLNKLIERDLEHAREICEMSAGDAQLEMITPASFCFSFDSSDEFYRWFEGLQEANFHIDATTFAEQGTICVRSVEDGYFTLIDYSEEFEVTRIFVVPVPQTTVSMHTLEGMYEMMRGGVA